MGLFDKFKRKAGKAKDLAGDNAAEVADGVDKATDVIDDKTKGRFTEHLDKVDEAAADLGEDAGTPDTGAVDPGPGDSTDA